MIQGIFEKEIFIHSDTATVLNVKVERATEKPAGVRRYFTIEDTVPTEAYQSPGTTVIKVTKVMPRNDGILLRAPDMLFDHAIQQVNIAHEEMLKRIKQFVINK